MGNRSSPSPLAPHAPVSYDLSFLSHFFSTHLPHFNDPAQPTPFVNRPLIMLTTRTYGEFSLDRAILLGPAEPGQPTWTHSTPDDISKSHSCNIFHVLELSTFLPSWHTAVPRETAWLFGPDTDRPETPNDLSIVPDELLMLIFEFCCGRCVHGVREFNPFMRVSRRFYGVANQAIRIFLDLFEKDGDDEGDGQLAKTWIGYEMIGENGCSSWVSELDKEARSSSGIKLGKSMRFQASTTKSIVEWLIRMKRGYDLGTGIDIDETTIKSILKDMLILHFWETIVRFGMTQIFWVRDFELEDEDDQLAHLERRLQHWREMSCEAGDLAELFARCDVLLVQLGKQMKEKRPEGTDKFSIQKQLVYDLRTHNGRLGSCASLSHDPRGDDSPYAHLRALGSRQVLPIALKHWDDPTLSRSIAHHRPFFFSHRVVRVGEIVRNVASDLAGKHFRSKAEAQAFWTVLRRSRSSREFLEKRMLGNGFENGIQLYLKSFGESDVPRCVDLVRQVLSQENAPPLAREQAILYLKNLGLEVDGVEDLLRREVDVSGSLSAAIFLLNADGPTDEIVSLLRTAFVEGDDQLFFADNEEIVQLLLMAGEASFLHEFMTKDDVPVRRKVACIQSFMDSRNAINRAEKSRTRDVFRQEISESQPLIEDILLSCLDDGRTTSSSGSIGSVRYSHLRVKDYAACALAKLRPKFRYRQTNYALSERFRDRLIEERIGSVRDGVAPPAYGIPEAVPLKNLKNAFSEKKFDFLRSFGAGIVQTTLEFLWRNPQLDRSPYESFMTRMSFVVFGITIDGVKFAAEEISGQELTLQLLERLLFNHDHVTSLTIDRSLNEFGIEICMSQEQKSSGQKYVQWAVRGDVFQGSSVSRSSDSSLLSLIQENVPLEELKKIARWEKAISLSFRHM